MRRCATMSKTSTRMPFAPGCFVMFLGATPRQRFSAKHTTPLSDAPAELLIEGARKAGLPACIANDAAAKQPNFVSVRSCDAERTKATSG